MKTEPDCTDAKSNGAAVRDQAIVTPREERRMKIVSIDARFVVDLLNWWREPPYWLALPITDELPEDCEVVSVATNWERNCIEAIVASASFPPSVQGAMLDRIPGLFTEMRRVSAIQLV